MAEIDFAFDPKNPQLSRVTKATDHLIRFLKDMSRYNQMLKEYEASFQPTDESQHLDDILQSIHSNATVGSVLCAISKRAKDDASFESDNALDQVKQSLLDIKLAMQRSKIGTMKFQRSTNAEMTKEDVSVLRDTIRLKRPTLNLLWHCLHLRAILEEVEANLTMHQLFMHENNQDSINMATNLWNAVKSGDVFDPETTSMRKYREEVVLRAFTMKQEKYNAFQVACLMSTKLTKTDLGKGTERKDMILPLFRNAMNKRIDGKIDALADDYCGGDNDTHLERRGKMVCVTLNLTTQLLIAQHVSKSIFPFGLARSILIQSPSRVKDCCNFQYYKNFCIADEEGQPVVHDRENIIVHCISSKFTSYDVREQFVVVDAESIEKLEELVKM